MAMSAGLASFNDLSVNSLMKQFRDVLTEKLREGQKYTLEKVTDFTNSAFRAIYAGIDKPPGFSANFKFWIGGYGSDMDHGEVWKIEIRNGQLSEPVQLASKLTPSRIMWGGQAQALERLVRGHDPRIELVSGTDDLANEKERFEQIRFLEAPLAHEFMPVRDAANLAAFLVDLTIKYVSFLPEPNTVGGAIDVAAVTRHEGFKWIQRKHCYPPELN